jgi:DNA-directed RNA polymerase specialized sigma24 family protein
LGRLSDVHRNLLLWRYGEDLSVGEVAWRCGRRRGSVAQTLWRIRQALRERLADIS